MKDIQISPKINPLSNNADIYQGPKAILPAFNIPSFNVQRAFEAGVKRKFLINTWGGLGDQICAEPAMRFAFKDRKSVV